MSQYQTSPYQRIVNALNEWRAACGLSLLASELDAKDAAETAESLVADWQRLDKACQNARQDVASYTQRLAGIDAVLLRHNVQASSADESITATIERVLSDYAKERECRKAAEDNAVAWQAEGDAANAELAAELAKERQRRKAAEDDAAAWRTERNAQLQAQTERADTLRNKLTAARDELTSIKAQRDDIQQELANAYTWRDKYAIERNEANDKLRVAESELAEARADRNRACARAESYTATLLDINDVLVQAKVNAPGEDSDIVDIAKALVAERDTARYDAASWEADVIKNRQALQEAQEAQADAAKWQARYGEVSDTLYRMVRLHLVKEACQ